MLFPAIISALVLVGFDHSQTPAALIVGLGLRGRGEILSIKRSAVFTRKDGKVNTSLRLQQFVSKRVIYCRKYWICP